MRAESVFWPMFAPARICSRMSSSLPSCALWNTSPALGARLDRLGPGDEAVVVGLLRAEHVVELERMLGLGVGGAAGEPEHQREQQFHRWPPPRERVF
jgi:hypothetical protein